MYGTIGLIMISTGFLADALRRFKKQITKQKNLKLNSGLMKVHITVVTLQVVVSIVVWIILRIIASMGKPNLYGAIEIFYFALDMAI